MFISGGMAGVRRELVCSSCFVVAKDCLVVAVLFGALRAVITAGLRDGSQDWLFDLGYNKWVILEPPNFQGG